MSDVKENDGLFVSSDDEELNLPDEQQSLNIFQGFDFWVHISVQDRNELVASIEQYGGKVVDMPAIKCLNITSKNHLRPLPKKFRSLACFSPDFITDSISAGQLQEITGYILRKGKYNKWIFKEDGSYEEIVDSSSGSEDFHDALEDNGTENDSDIGSDVGKKQLNKEPNTNAQVTRNVDSSPPSIPYKHPQSQSQTRKKFTDPRLALLGRLPTINRRSNSPAGCLTIAPIESNLRGTAPTTQRRGRLPRIKITESNSHSYQNEDVVPSRSSSKMAIENMIEHSTPGPSLDPNSQLAEKVNSTPVPLVKSTENLKSDKSTLPSTPKSINQRTERANSVPIESSDAGVASSKELTRRGSIPSSSTVPSRRIILRLGDPPNSVSQDIATSTINSQTSTVTTESNTKSKFTRQDSSPHRIILKLAPVDPMAVSNLIPQDTTSSTVEPPPTTLSQESTSTLPTVTNKSVPTSMTIPATAGLPPNINVPQIAPEVPESTNIVLPERIASMPPPTSQSHNASVNPPSLPNPPPESSRQSNVLLNKSIRHGSGPLYEQSENALIVKILCCMEDGSKPKMPPTKLCQALVPIVSCPLTTLS